MLLAPVRGMGLLATERSEHLTENLSVLIPGVG